MEGLQLKPRACPVCGSREEGIIYAPENFTPDRLSAVSFASRKLPEYMHYRLVLCPECSLVYANPAPGLDGLAQAYQHAEYDSGSEAEFAARTYARILPAVLAKAPRRGAALDVGAGDGAFLRCLLAAGFSSVRGVEPSEAPIASAQADVRDLIRQGLFRGSDYEPATFDLVTCFQTIEHLYDPAESCCQMTSLLSEGGALFIVCHNRRAWSARLLGRRSPIFDIEHLQLFSPSSLRALLDRCGLQDVHVTTVINTYPLRYWVKLMPLPAAVKNPLLRTLSATRIGAVPISLPAGNIAAWGYRPVAPPLT